MKDRSCLNCKYEPTWGPVTGKDYPRRYGPCRWFESHSMPLLPAVVKTRTDGVTRYSDDSGVMTHCQTWEKP